MLSPNGAYNGQKLTKLVKTNILANTTRTIPGVPGITLVKYNTAKIAAIVNLINRSALPMFFFIVK